MNLKSLADNGQGVSTINRDDYIILMDAFAGRNNKAPYETVVFPKGELLFVENLDLSTVSYEDAKPLHTVYWDNERQAITGHQEILDAINSGTLKCAFETSD